MPRPLISIDLGTVVFLAQRNVLLVLRIRRIGLSSRSLVAEGMQRDHCIMRKSLSVRLTLQNSIYLLCRAHSSTYVTYQHGHSLSAFALLRDREDAIVGQPHQLGRQYRHASSGHTRTSYPVSLSFSYTDSKVIPPSQNLHTESAQRISKELTDSGF